MPSAFKTIVRSFISLLFAVYLLCLLWKSHFFLSNPLLWVAGIIISAAAYFITGYLFTRSFSKPLVTRLVSASVAITGFIMLASPGSIKPIIGKQGAGFIKVTALGTKNDSSHMSEVWITNIYNGETELNLGTISLNEGWEEKYHHLASFDSTHQPAVQEIPLKYPGKFEIEFIRHNWSGKVKIEDGQNTTIIDLYKEDPIGSYRYIGNSGIPGQKSNMLLEFGLWTLTLLVVTIFWFLCLAFMQEKNRFLLLPVPLSVFVFFLADYFPLTYTGKFLALAISILSYYITRKITFTEYANRFTVKEKIFFILIILYGTFAFVGHQLFLSYYPVKQLVHKTAYFLLFACWLSIISITFLYFTELIKSKLASRNSTTDPLQAQPPVKLFFRFMGIMIACWLVYFIAFFPANMSADSLDQWAQATGIISLNNWHPVFHTLFNKLCLTIYKSPASIAIAQMLFMSAVMASFLLFLSKKGIPVKWLYWTALVLGIIPANGIYAVTLWKDVAFTISLVWLTLVLAKIITHEAYLKQRSASIEIALALLAAGLFRHNGMLVYILAVAALVAYYFKTKKAGILIGIGLSIAIMAGYYAYISSPERVTPNAPAVKLVAPVDGIAAVLYHNGNLPEETKREMYKVLPDSIWRSHYRPFSADEYLFYTNRPFVENLSKIPTSKVLQLYLNTLAKNPYLVIRDRLNGTEIVWNVIEANGSFNYRYCEGIDPNDFGIRSHGGFLKKVLQFFLNRSVTIADPFLWRAGIFNFLLLLLLLLLAKQRKWYMLLFIPVFGTNFSLLLSMTLQNFRYVYYVPLIFGFIWLLSISDLMAKGKN